MDFWILFKDLSPFAMAGFVTLVLGRLYLNTQLKETEARIKLAELDMQRVEREAKLAEALAVHQTQQSVFQVQQTAALAALLGGQKQTAQTVVATNRQVIASGKTSTAAIMEAISEVMRGMVKLAAGQTDQTTALNMITEAVHALHEMLTPITEVDSERKTA